MAQVKDIVILHEVEELSQRQIAKQLGISRGTVARVLSDPDRYLGTEEKRVDRTAPKMTSAIMQYIDTILKADQQVRRKQRHTSRAIWEKVVEAFGPMVAPAESTVRRYVGQARRRDPEPFIPLSFAPGEAAQGDFGEVHLKIAGKVQRALFWASRLCHSRAMYVTVFQRATQEAFLEGQQEAFRFFGGVPKRQIIDNLKAGIGDGVGRNALAQPNYLAFQAHYAFRHDACNAAAGHEKGQVENLVGFTQRNIFPGLPEFDDWEAVVAEVARRCERYLDRPHPDHPQRSIRELFEEERRVLRALPAYPFPCCKHKAATANKQSLVRFEANSYSIPTEHRLQPLILRAYTRRIEIICEGRVVAEHPRAEGRGQVVVELSHYLRALLRKPRALENARPFQQAKLAPCLLQLLERLKETDPDRANRRWVEIALLGETVGGERLHEAVDAALRMNRYDLETVRYLCTRPAESSASPEPLQQLPGGVTDIEVAHQSAARFDQLLTKTEGVAS